MDSRKSACHSVFDRNVTVEYSSARYLRLVFAVVLLVIRHPLAINHDPTH